MRFCLCFERSVCSEGIPQKNSERWTSDALISSVRGSVDEPMMAIALNKWVNIGVTKEEEGGEFVLLEVQEEGGVKPPTSR